MASPKALLSLSILPQCPYLCNGRVKL